MPRRKSVSTDLVGLVHREIMRLYAMLSPEEQRELERRLYAEPSFGRLMKFRINLYTKEWVLLRRKDSHRSRKPSPAIQDRNARIRADRERGLSLGELVKKYRPLTKSGIQKIVSKRIGKSK
jgi:hypothetical protein